MRLVALIESPVGFDFYDATFACEPMTVAAPWPVFRLFHKAPLDWVAVDITELLGELRLREDVEVVVALFPEMWTFTFEALRGFCFQRAEDALQFRLFGFVDEEMDVFGHEDVAVHVEAVTRASTFEKFEEHCAGVVVVEEGKTLEATEGDEVVVSEGVEALQSAWHFLEDTENLETGT